MNSSQDAVIDVGEHYVKQTFRNRCSLRSANGQLDLSIPVIRPNGNKTPTGIVEVSHDKGWRRDHFRSIQAAYASSPYFDHYAPEIELLIFQETKLLKDFNKRCLRLIQDVLSLDLQLSYSEVYIENPSVDFRNFDFPNDTNTYQQVHFEDSDFQPGLSILDALFCLGPMARNLIVDPPITNRISYL